MLRKSSASDKVEKIILDRMKHRMIDVVRRKDNAEYFAEVVRDKLDHFYNNLVFSALDLGVRNGRALDLGTQFGLCGLGLARQDYDFSITAAQDSSSFTKVSMDFAGERMVDNKLSWAKGVPEKLPFRDNTFDLVISGFDLHHWENPVEGFNEIERVMKTKGALLVGDFRRGAFRLMMPLIKTLSYVVKREELYEELKTSFKSSYTKDEIQQILRASNLSGYTVSKDVQFLYVKKEPKKKRHVVAEMEPA